MAYSAGKVGKMLANRNNRHKTAVIFRHASKGGFVKRILRASNAIARRRVIRYDREGMLVAKWLDGVSTAILPGGWPKNHEPMHSC